MRSLADKTGLVTGAARGIGRAIALRLAAKGVRLLLADRDVVGLSAIRREVERLGGEAVAAPCDLADPAQVDRLADHAMDRWVGVDLLVNNAGVAYHGPTQWMPADRLRLLMEVNLHAPMRLTGALLPALLARPEAHVLNVCSVLGLVGMPRAAAYCASKRGLLGYSDALRAEHGRWGLGVSALCPGFVRTTLLAEASAEGQDRSPPALLCVSVDRVARAAVRAIERNRRRVVVDPVLRPLRLAMLAAPGVADWVQSHGRGRRIAAKRRELAALDPDRSTALRKRLGIDPTHPAEAA